MTDKSPDATAIEATVDLAAYDKLPPKVRKVLQDASRSYASWPILNSVRRRGKGYRNATEAAETLAMQDREMCEALNEMRGN